MNLGIVGKTETETRLYPNRFAIVNNRTGRPLDICSDQYHIHKPADIVRAATEAFSDIGMKITGIGTLHGGESVVLDATVGTNVRNEFSGLDNASARQAAGYAVGDPIEGHFTLKIGNTVGNPTKGSVHMIEVVCLNSMTSERVVNLAVTHRNGSGKVVLSLQNVLGTIQAVHTKVRQARAKLTTQPATLETMYAYLMELSQPDLFNLVLDKTIADRGQYTPDVQRSHFLDSLNSHDDVAWFLQQCIDRDGNRFLKKTVTNLNSQPMASETRGSLYQPYMAATYAVDHLATGRGEFASDNVLDNAIFGTGQAFKSKALDLVLGYGQIGKGVN